MEILLYIIFGYLAFSAGYYLYFSVLSRFSVKVDKPVNGEFSKIAVMIPAYKEDAVILETAIKSLNQEYPSDRFDVVIIADQLKAETIMKLDRLPIKVIEVQFEKSTKAKALNEAFRQLDSSYDVAVVLDADNIMKVDFLNEINKSHNQGYKAIQGQRVAKNLNNTMSILDGISEGINNSIFRKGHRVSGLSSALIGSGMAFDFEMLKNYMAGIDAIGGFDKELELALLKDRVTIQYQENAIVRDEKVSNSEVFAKQRTRWIAAQIRYGMKSFSNAFIHLITKGNVDYFDKSLQFVMPPRIILLGILGLCFLISIVSGNHFWIWSSGITLASYVSALFIAIPQTYPKKDILRVAYMVPKTFVLMVISMFGFRKAKTNFLHTPHQIQS